MRRGHHLAGARRWGADTLIGPCLTAPISPVDMHCDPLLGASAHEERGTPEHAKISLTLNPKSQ